MLLNSVNLHDKKFSREIELFLVSTDQEYWEGMARKFETVGGVFYKNYLQIRNPFVEGIRQYLDLRTAGKSLWKHSSPELDYLVGKVFIVNRILKHVSDKAKNEIIGKLKSGDIRSFLHELTIATHFLRHKFDVDFVEYERPQSIGSTFDFLISKTSIQAEVECKTKSYDAGRKITRQGFYILCDEIVKQLASYKVKCVIEIYCLERLGKDQNFFIEIARVLNSAIRNRSELLKVDDNFSIKIHFLPSEVMIDSEKSFTLAIQPFRTPQSHFATLSGNETTLIIKVESEAEDIVLSALYDELKKSLSQFSSRRPGVIACHIEGVYPEQWKALRSESGLAAMTTKLLDKEKANYIHTVAYSSMGEVIKEGHVIDHKYPVLFYKNENSLYYKGQDIFELTADIP